MAVRARERHAVVHALLKQGHGVREIARRLNLGRNTVRRFARAGNPEDLLVHTGTGQRPKALDAYDGYLRKRWTQGCTNAELLCRELRNLGNRGSSTAVRKYVRPWRRSLPPTPTSPRPPTVRQATGWFLRNPTHLEPGEQHQLEHSPPYVPSWQRCGAMCVSSPK
ncbi:helix-turn-helix domain-containing protein [Microbispora sp. NPDC046933]|uniref:helix-turn-helix domain-containing protein n=1 Tax=Microbispora sp. NPDC046933 TaxID=3155618 RepID=UPI0033E3BD11